MKTYNVSNRISAQAKREIERIVNTHEAYRKSYFFNAACNASARRRNEERFANANYDVCFVKGSKTIIVTMSYSESCKNVYYKLSVVVAGQDASKSGNIADIKKLLH